VPTISVFKKQETPSYIRRTRIVIDFQLAKMQNGINAVVRITNGNEIPSTPCDR